MRRSIVSLAALCCGLVGSTQVLGLRAPACCGNFEIIGEALIMRPTSCDLNYVARVPLIDDAVEFVGTERGICPDYNWGFRVGVGYIHCCEHDARLIFSHLKTSDHDSQEAAPGDVLAITWGWPRGVADFPFGGVAQTADEKVRFEWNAVDAEVAMRKMPTCDFFVRGHVGLHYAALKLNRTAHYEAVDGDDIFDATIQENSHSWGIGPRIGLDLRYELVCGLGVGAHAGLAILAGEGHDTNHQLFLIPVSFVEQQAPLQEPLSLDIRHRSRCMVFPEFDVSLGVNYLWGCSNCFSLLTEVGYEFRSYLNGLLRTTFNSTDVTNIQSCENMNIDGVYLRFTLQV